MAIDTHELSYLLRFTDQMKLTAPESGGPQITKTLQDTWEDGTSDGQIDVAAVAQYTIGASATQSVDFAGGSLTQADGSTATFAEVALLVVQKVSGDGTVRMEAPANFAPFFAASGDATQTLADDGDFVAICVKAGVTITAGTGDLLSLVEQGGASSVVVNLYAFGRSA